ncbi:thiamine pyrophosphate-binding protein [Bacillus thuringiensis]|uniref:thiamine pyrophosphate-binding protein n=1 Tax=Bacillus thuringiensis TaxID=1428 RepID=UPI001C3F1719|nr:thiamine pyrophosphate-binding protein [Bacillus thuringiensis]
MFYNSLKELGYNFFTGVPCSFLKGLYPLLEQGGNYYPATREDLALGLAAGAALVGHSPVVFMQNSGLGLSINTLLSLQKMYHLPVLLIITWRGQGPDAPEHVEAGSCMIPLLETLGIPYRMATTKDAIEPEFHNCTTPVALIIRQGDFQ